MVDAKIPFVIGVVGKIKLPGYRDDVSDPDRFAPAVRAVYDQVWRLLDWTLGFTPSGPNPIDATGRRFRSADDLPVPLGLRHTPVVVLSSLAPGADTIVAEAALDYATQTGRAVTVRAPLSFPVEIYRDASTFCPSSEPGIWTARQARLDSLLARLRAQPGYEEDRDLFCVALHPELEGNPQADLTGVTPAGLRRHLRYRAAGEYVATSSHLLLAVYDERDAAADAKPPDDQAGLQAPGQALRALHFQCGTAVIVEAKRRGLSFQLLAVSHNFSWADNGPVLRIPIDAGTDGNLACARPLAWLHPYDTQPRKRDHRGFIRDLVDRIGLGGWKPPKPVPEAKVDDDDPDWQWDGHDLLRRMSDHLDRFNALPRHPKEEAEAPPGAAPGRHRLEPEETADSYNAVLRPLKQLRRRSSERATQLDERRKRLLRTLLLLILVSAGCLSAYEHWNPGLYRLTGRGAHDSGIHQPTPLLDTTEAAVTPGHSDRHRSGEATTMLIESYGRVRAALLSLCLFLLGLISVLYWRHRRSGAERERHDLRAMAEGLRVQIAWSTAGLPTSVAADYMQRQRGELDWIRRAIQVATLPVEVRARRFSGLPVAAQAALLDCARDTWVKEQIRFFRTTASKAAFNHRRFRQLGWSIAAAALLNVVAKWLCAVSPAIHHWIETRSATASAASASFGIALVVIGGLRQRRERRQGAGGADSDESLPPHWITWLLGRPFLWGVALVAAIVPLGLPHLLVRLISVGPDLHNWWMILTGITLAAGLLGLAWTERSFHAEDARRYRAMAHLFECADRRLGSSGPACPTVGLIERYRQSGDSRVLTEIHDILYQLGQDALDENAEWLILRRTHPLEPFMAG